MAGMKYVAFLRGINIGGRTIRMTELQACFRRHGFGDVTTVLQTGNVLFESPEGDVRQLRGDIETMLSTEFGYAAQVKIVTIEALQKIIASYPFMDAPGDMHRYVIFVDGDPAGLLAAGPLEADTEAIQAADEVVYWRVIKGHTLDSDFAKVLAKYSAKNFATNRNLNTLEKIAAKA